MLSFSFIVVKCLKRTTNVPCLSQQQQTWFWSTVTTLVSYTWRQNEPSHSLLFLFSNLSLTVCFVPFLTLVSLFHSPVLVSVKTFVLSSKFWLFVYFCVRAVILKCLRIESSFVSDIFVLSLRVFLIFSDPWFLRFCDRYSVFHNQFTWFLSFYRVFKILFKLIPLCCQSFICPVSFFKIFLCFCFVTLLIRSLSLSLLCIPISLWTLFISFYLFILSDAAMQTGCCIKVLFFSWLLPPSLSLSLVCVFLFSPRHRKFSE